MKKLQRHPRQSNKVAQYVATEMSKLYKSFGSYSYQNKIKIKELAK